MKVLDENYLLDSFEMNGNDKEQFETIVREIDKHTVHLKRCINCLDIISIMPPELQDQDGAIKAYYLSLEDPTGSGTLKNCEIPQEKFLERGAFQSVIQEAFEKNSTLFLDREANSIYFVSKAAINTIGQRIDVNGEALHEPSIERDIFMARKMNQSLTVTLVIKHFRSVGKIFAMMSKTYAEIPLLELCDIYSDLMAESKLGPMNCLAWSVNHSRVRISFSFDKYAEEISAVYGLKSAMVPCVELMTSDTGECSFLIRGFWKTENQNIVFDRDFAKKHSGKVNLPEIEKAIRETIFDKYTELPERLMSLMAIDITPPGIDITTNRGKGKNHKAVLNTFKYIFKQIDLVKVIGKQRVLALTDYIDYSMINEDQYYSAYDIVTDVFSLPGSMKAYLEQEGMSEGLLRKFQEAVSRTPYLDFDKKTGEKQTDLFLTAV